MSESKRILILEDEPVIRSLLADMLRNKGYEVLESGNGEDAVGRFEDAAADGDSFDLLVLDLTLPGELTGTDVLARSRELLPGVKAIIASGYADDDEVLALCEKGQTELLQKPYNMADLISLVQEMLP